MLKTNVLFGVVVVSALTMGCAAEPADAETEPVAVSAAPLSSVKDVSGTFATTGDFVYESDTVVGDNEIITGHVPGHISGSIVANSNWVGTITVNLTTGDILLDGNETWQISSSPLGHGSWIVRQKGKYNYLGEGTTLGAVYGGTGQLRDAVGAFKFVGLNGGTYTGKIAKL